MKKINNHRLYFQILSVLVLLLHLCIVIFFFLSPFLPFWWQVSFLALGIITLPLRILFFKGKCPFTGWERYCRKKGGDTQAKIHTHTFMETYFGMPDGVFKKIEKGIMLLLIISIIFQIVTKKNLWSWLFSFI